MDERSQLRNKEIAIERLEKIFNGINKELEDKNKKEIWIKHYKLERGNEVACFIGDEFKRKK